jgi:hypothetical protein
VLLATGYTMFTSCIFCCFFCRNWKPAKVDGLPEVFTGGWVGYAGYDTVRYVYGSELLLSNSSNHSASALGTAVAMRGS